MYGNPRYPHVFTPPFPTRVSSDLVETTDEIGRKRLHALVAQHVEHGLHHNLDRGPRRLRIGHVELFRRIDDAELRHLAMLDECALVGFGQSLVHARCRDVARSEEHTSELQSLMRSSYGVCCLKQNRTRRK